MPIAAVPHYLQKDDPEFYLSAPPGHRFLLYFAVWGSNGETQRIDWRTKDKVKKFKRVKGESTFDSWTDIENDQFACTIAACKTPADIEETPRARRPKPDAGLKPWKPTMEALLARQQQAFDAITIANSSLRLDARATAPFTTGLGNEHPLENGFAFLNPYGLPYLPGSGVKGVLRQAARELASGQWGDTHGWSEVPTYALPVGKQHLDLSVIDVLFGRESGDGETQHLRGALSFWDVIPQIAGDSLMVEIMTPHQSHYYQQKAAAGSTSPHDSGSPNPISFLTVPPGSRFAFHVVCDAAHLARLMPCQGADAPDLVGDGGKLWKALVEQAFDHAFTWLGFGAKTAVGYGAMSRPDPSGSGARKADAGVGTQEQIWKSATLEWDAGRRQLSARSNDSKAECTCEKSEGLLAGLSDDQRTTLTKKKKPLKGVDVVVEVKGNLIVLKGLA